MADESAISWTDSTYNPWIGCTKVGPGCDNCYAERDNGRRKWVAAWGAGVPRKRTKTFKQLRKWQDEAAAFFAEHGRKRRVFAASLADIFDNEIDEGWRTDFWADVEYCTDLELYIVTKRISNVRKMLPPNWSKERYGHVVLLITVVNQDEADRDVWRLLQIKAMDTWLRVGLSIEPMLGPITLRRLKAPNGERYSALAPWVMPGLDWVICGGESDDGRKAEDGERIARPCPPEYPMAVAIDCANAKVPFHFKQVGNNHEGWEGITGKGKDIAEWPEPLRVQQFPRETAT